jgi:hypothetical protein
MSFFDEDDEPARTTTRSRTRSQPRPRRGTPAGGGRAPDPQQTLIRRMVGVLIIAAVILVFGILIKACSDSRHKSALEDYNRQLNNIATASAQTGTEFFRAMGGAANHSPEDLQQSISSFKVNAEQQLKQAQDLSVPGEMQSAQQSALIALELRRDGLAKVAGEIRTALGDQGQAADDAIKSIAGQMMAFNASDVLWDARVIPFVKDALTKGDINQPTIQDSNFLTEISWISDDYVAQQLGQQLSAQNSGNRNQPTGPGLHGTGLNATSYGNVTLQPGTTNRLTFVQGQPFTVSFTNQGDNDEFNVKVTLKIARDTGSPITINKTVQKVAKGEKATVELPLNRQPPINTAVTVSVVVGAVPGETKTDNNKSSYPTLFVQG